jgi:secondary-alkyl amine dehydrogenase [NAD(P)+]
MDKMNYRIAVYGMGFVGQQLAGFALDKGWQVVGAYNRAGNKVGQDVGTLLGRDPINVLVEDCNTADFTKLQADVGFVATTDWLKDNFAAYERFLSAGINVLCHGSEANHPRICDEETANKIDALAKANGVTFTGGGIWDSTRIWSGIIIAGPNLSIESMHHISHTDVGRQGVHQLKRLGAGMAVDEYKKVVMASDRNVTGLPKIPACSVATGLGFEITGIKERIEPVVWDTNHNSQWLGMVIPAGDVVGTRMLVDIETAQGATFHSCFEYRDFREGDEEHMIWKVKGKPSMEIRVTRNDSGMASASSLFNRVPDVVAGEPGIVELWKLRPLRPSIF